MVLWQFIVLMAFLIAREIARECFADARANKRDALLLQLSAQLDDLNPTNGVDEGGAEGMALLKG